MEISERSLHRMVQEADDLHREGMQTIAEDIATSAEDIATSAEDIATSAEDIATIAEDIATIAEDIATIAEDIAALPSRPGERLQSRRGFLAAAGLGGLALTAGGVALPMSGLLSPAAAQALDDKTLVMFAESLELAAAQAYLAAVQSGKIQTPAVLAAATAFGGHHQQHAQAFGAFAGDTATAKPNPLLLQTVSDQIKAARDEKGVLLAAYQLENAAAATYLFAIGALVGVDVLATTASILPVEAQHAVVLGHVLGKDPASDINYLPPFQTPDDAIQPSKYPLAS